MNHLTTSQIIDIGEYLDPVFDAHRLTIAQLRGILQYHEISCSSKCTKKDLLKAFRAGITAHHQKLTLERNTATNTASSSSVIVEGHTGSPIVSHIVNDILLFLQELVH